MTEMAETIPAPPRMGVQERMLLRLRVDEFLTEEASLLDSWQLDEWLALFTDDGSYVVPSTDLPDGDPTQALTLIDDDHLRLTWRVNRLKSRHAHREFPYSRTRRLITNVRIAGIEGDEVAVEATVVVHRFRHGHRDAFIGLGHWRLVDDGDAFRIRARRMELDLERLSPNGALRMVF
jgi:p-cumate 2,3-dioxygenase beta subunit